MGQEMQTDASSQVSGLKCCSLGRIWSIRQKTNNICLSKNFQEILGFHHCSSSLYLVHFLSHQC